VIHAVERLGAIQKQKVILLVPDILRYLPVLVLNTYMKPALILDERAIRFTAVRTVL
jgi:hypothetical protein